LIDKNPRRRAWEFLRDIEREDSYINIAILKLYPEVKPSDRPFLTELLLGSTRMRKRLDFLIDALSEREIDAQTRSVLRLAFYELFFMNSADHAIGFEYVELSKTVIGRARSGFINALLRRAVRERDSLNDDQKMDLATRTSHPQWIVDAYQGHFISKLDALENELISHNRASPVHVVSFDALDSEIASPSNVTPYGFRLKVAPSEVSAIRDGKAFVQDEGSQIVAELALATDRDRSMKWLDLCAGPGGKFAYLAHFLDAGHLEGNEIHDHRARMVRERVPSHRVHTGDGRELVERHEMFDRILVDAPCTGIGALRRKADVRWRRTEDDLKGLISLQRELLDRAAEMLSLGGLVLYVTCSPHLMETKAQVKDFLKRHKGFSQGTFSMGGLSETFQRQVGNAMQEDGSLQLFTDRDGTDAMFMALLRRDA
jgi:16S rRNA (cytosine967-C5)-methyltransferase